MFSSVNAKKKKKERFETILKRSHVLPHIRSPTAFHVPIAIYAIIYVGVEETIHSSKFQGH